MKRSGSTLSGITLATEIVRAQLPARDADVRQAYKDRVLAKLADQLPPEYLATVVRVMIEQAVAR